MNIRLLKKSEIKQAARIVGINYSKKWEKSSAKELKDMFSKGAVKPVYWVAEEKGSVIGFAGYIQSWMDYDIYQIFWVNVIPERQSQGIGKKLVVKVISEIKKHKNASLILLTADKSVGNNGYYKKKFGFKTLQVFGKSPYHLMSLAIK